MTETSTSLWRHANFRNLWLGQTASTLGSKMTGIALPLVAAQSLSASVFEMGLIVALEYVPYLLIGLFVGVWLDRRPKRPIIAFSDAARAVLLLAVPLAWWQDWLSAPLLMLIAFLVGCCSVISDVGTASFLPTVVSRKDLVQGNSKLEMSISVTNIGGSSVGGAVIQVMTAPFALIANAVTYAVSALFTLRITTAETPREGSDEGGSIWQDIREGLAFIVHNPTIRVLTGATLIFNFFTLAFEPIFLIFIVRTLEIEPIYIGLIFSATGAGALIGALIAERMGRALGLGRTLVVSTTLAGLASALLPVATVVPVALAIALVVVMRLVDGAMVIVGNVNLRSYRAAITPDHLQGRMNASIRTVVTGIAPVGAVVGGALGAFLGVTAALVVASVGILQAGVVLALSPVRSVTDVPGVLENEEEEPALKDA
ncbi:MFS transporter [Streptomyces litchfieldiae]|uniref:MFS transporter n=1 Tax=Streptomyces litchfieldiae TaxID=3075543 RepID=A0ABU2MQN3_9ACTN|nr:MFS transporter [Streptomyces sp. DSM 44938]MDT0343940.1 MFS transporter [Streptomyces sp. DSM 44938]